MPVATSRGEMVGSNWIAPLSGLVIGLILASAGGWLSFGLRLAEAEAPAPKFEVESVRGRIVFFGPALKQQLGVQLVPEAVERTLAIETSDGQLIPILEDLRGRSLRTDERLRDMELELLVRRYSRTPAIQILRIYQWHDDKKYQVDYWCDVCSIVMFETGPCSCCQDHNRLRRRPVDLVTGETVNAEDEEAFPVPIPE